ncbi:Methyltransferase domain-containing protein [Actinacidiphila rubida]|uniref:Methyltransferase domain-containing protein n=1 Tax=Actinacidiphila rubida TaxID=310780 RepID=A0A1H8T671_9ACTN|nr:class I SAM-dependent methyltransferase [Actinacidiphila rubida]SEO86038.1 Methyltransferase domain-containing protein [Actinacidiphila rubida]
MTYDESGIIDAIERLARTDVAALTQDQLDGVDQFHAGGPEAVDRLVPALRLGPGTTLLDVGSGFGGPARQIARATGCDVVGVDITAAYVEAARELTAHAGLDARVRFHHTRLSGLPLTGFDAAVTLHVQMNVADKRAFYADIAARLRPGARLAVHEVCRAGDARPPLPLPWSLDGSDSFLATPDELRRDIAAAGFDLVEWTDDTSWAADWFSALGRRLSAAPAPLTLPALLADGPTRMLNYAIALTDGTLTLHRGTFTAS